MENQKAASSGISLGTVLFLIFLVLKLAGIGQVATWSWWWVTSPLWIPIVFVVAILAVVGIIYGIAKMFE
jgi:hypothetical protein